ncbi:MAG: hypothetical protein WBQ73_02085 [Candidatus Babeliales bacterium]
MFKKIALSCLLLFSTYKTHTLFPSVPTMVFLLAAANFLYDDTFNHDVQSLYYTTVITGHNIRGRLIEYRLSTANNETFPFALPIASWNDTKKLKELRSKNNETRDQLWQKKLDLTKKSIEKIVQALNPNGSYAENLATVYGLFQLRTPPSIINEQNSMYVTSNTN